VASFGLAKSAIYVAPIAVAAIAPASVYASFELAQALALLLATTIVIAPVHAMGHRQMKTPNARLRTEAAVLVAGCCAMGLLISLSAAVAGADPYLLMSVSLTGIAGTQIVLSFALRMERSGNALVPWTDGLIVFVGLLMVLVLSLSPQLLGVRSVSASFVAATAAVGAVGLFVFLKGPRPPLSQLRIDFALGVPMGVYAIFGSWVAVCGRVLIGSTVPEELAAYGVAFRVAGLIVIVAQLVTTGLWKHLYTCSSLGADKLLSLAVLGTLVLALVASEAGQLFVLYADLEALDPQARKTCREILPILALQIFFWAAHQMLQPTVNRSGFAGRLLLPTAAFGLAGAAFILAAASSGVGIVVLSWLLAAYTAGFFLISWLLLARRGECYPRMAALTAAGAALLAAVELV
jgi:hypothetical protein